MAEAMIEVSVIIPVYNTEKNLEQCVRSVMGQTLSAIEIICVDDGSTDGSRAILERLAGEDARITVIAQENAGAGAARNRGMDRAKGRYLSFLDADDFFEPDMLEAALEKAKAQDAQVIVFGADFYDDRTGASRPCIYGVREDMMPEKRPFAGTDVERDIFKIVVGWAWDKLFLADFVRENGLRFQEQRTTNDAFFVFMAMAKAQRITTLPRILAHQRRHAGGTLSVTREKSWMCFYQALSAMRDQLKAWGLYERFEQDFINYALHFTLWNLNTLKDPTKGKLYGELRGGWFEALGVTGYPKEKFYHAGEYAQYRLIMALPYNPLLLRTAGFAQRGATYILRKLRRR